ncbi:hypothetical protein [Ruminococcus bicirculans (ex Wegman et al. 2014)]|uniref:hypothetical protein n=1 Tax=Ruminococcus bicirculans (ex Wegman et al. 2014) TaxID=1160721 RepID=UPI00307C099C
MITKEEFEKVVEVCTDGNMNCTQCPLGKKFYRCGVYFAHYIKETEPAPAATGTSSEVVSKDTDNIQLDDSTKEQICQAYDTVDEACTDIIDIYEGMSACERRAFDVGEVYGKICSTRNKLENMRGEN